MAQTNNGKGYSPFRGVFLESGASRILVPGMHAAYSAFHSSVKSAAPAPLLPFAPALERLLSTAGWLGVSFVPAEIGSRCCSLSFLLSPSLPVTRQPFNVECQRDGDVTLPAGWRPLGPTRVQRQRKALSDCAPPGARLPRVSARPHFLWQRGRPAAVRAVGLPGRGSSAISAAELPGS